MSSKPRTKKHSSNKRINSTFSNVRLWSWESMIDKDKTTVSHGELRIGHVWREMAQKQVTDLAALPMNWSICCRALCSNPEDGSVWLETSLRTVRDIRVNALAELYAEMRKDVMDELKDDGLLDSVLDCGWIMRTFKNTDPIDSGYESQHVGEISPNRHKLWLFSQENVHENIRL